MADGLDGGRRATLASLAALLVCALVPSTVAASERMTGSGRLSQDATAKSTGAPETDADRSLTGTYTGVIDRIVDGEHVVILLEDGERVLEQLVVPYGEYPFAREGRPVLVTLRCGVILRIRLLCDRRDACPPHSGWVRDDRRPSRSREPVSDRRTRPRRRPSSSTRRGRRSESAAPTATH